MGKIRPSLLKDKPAANVALHVVLDKSTVNKPILIAAILDALHGAGYSTYRTSHVEKFMKDAVMPRKDLVRIHVGKATDKYRIQDVKNKVRQYRIMDSYEGYMDENAKAKWSKQLKDAQDAAARWDTEHAANTHRAAALANLAKARKLRWQKKKKTTAPPPSATTPSFAHGGGGDVD